MGIVPLTNTFGRNVVSRNKVDTWFAIKGQAVVALAMRRLPGEIYKFDHAWRFARFFELRCKTNIPKPVSFFSKFAPNI